MTLACADARRGEEPAPKGLIERFDTIASPATSSIAVVADLGVAPDGTLWIADRGNRTLVSIMADGGGQQTYGRRGSGPGEMLRPEAISVTDSMILVVDPGNSRVQFFRRDGSAAGQFLFSRYLLVPISVNSRGDFAVPTIGQDSSLAITLSDSGRTSQRLGTPVVRPPSVINLPGLRQQALRGEIPLEFRNNVFPVLGEFGDTWLVLQSEGTVQHFDRRGQMKWSTALPDSIVSAAREDYLRKASAELNPARVPQPRVVSGARVYDGELWLMLSAGAERRNSLLVLDSGTGHVLRQIELNLTGAGLFALDRARNSIYVVLPEEGLIVTGKLVND
jgi:hypothetical protein